MPENENPGAGPTPGFLALLSNGNVQAIAAILTATAISLAAYFHFGSEQAPVAKPKTEVKLQSRKLIGLTKILKAEKCHSLGKDAVRALLTMDANYKQERQIWSINKEGMKFSGTLSLNVEGNFALPISGIMPDERKFIAYAEGTADSSSSYYAVKSGGGRYFKGYQTAHDCEGDIDLICPYVVGLVEDETYITSAYDWVRSTPCRIVE